MYVHSNFNTEPSAFNRTILKLKTVFLTSGLLLKSGIVWYTHTNDESNIGA